ncbi:PDZ domain-containing protein [Streptomyces sp. SID2955]|nr:PDZ domain-containing protein [Streptomyces sp. SID2955]
MNEGNPVPPVGEPEGPEEAAGAPPADRPGPAVPETTAPDGDFELARPAPTPPAPAPPAADGTGDPAATGRTIEADGSGDLAGTGRTTEADGTTAEVAADGPAAVTGPNERPRPLHDPDPYSTPPYGEPGPWAPAPPVQHPVVTPARGTAAPAPTAPPQPAPTAHGPAPVPPVLSVPTAHGPAPVPPAPSMPTAHGPVPPAPSPAAQGTVGPPMAQGAVSAPLVPEQRAVVAGSVVPAASVPGAGEEPWGRYDPWAAAAAGSAMAQLPAPGPLLQTGAGTLSDEQRLRRARRRVLAWALCIAVVAAGIGGVVGAYVGREGLGGDVRLPQAGGVPAGRAPDSVAGIAARALPSVVTLHVKGADQAGTGTGFVLDDRGHILTNNHVVEPAGRDGEISVTFSSGDTVEADVVGRDGGYDLAVVQVHGVHGLTPLTLGDSDDVRVGDPVVAIGAPFDLANTVTAGIISAKERPITAGGEKSDGSDVSYVDALQTDAPINPGNSGGPLLDSRAEVIGINSAIRSAGSGSTGGGQAGSIGLGFAIPVNQARRVAEELINEGHATHPVIGVTLDMGYTGDGARIDDRSASGGPAVTRGGPGERAGLEAGDVITEVGGERVHTGEELIVKIRAHRPGDRLRLTVERDGGERDVSLVLGASERN